MEYISEAKLFGLPLVHIASGGKVEDGVYRRSIAKGWIAVGDIAYGILFAIGGVAVGGFAIGGLGLGLLSIGGLSVGIAAFGGCAIGGFAVGGGAIGILAFGGGAIGYYAAMGGGAIAAKFAIGGDAVAEHANDAAACAYFANNWFFSKATELLNLPVFDFVCKRK